VYGTKYELVELESNDDGLYDVEKLITEINNLSNIKMGFFPGLCYQTGQRFNIKKITEALHSIGAFAGFDLAHSVGNYQLQLHKWNVDFATFCGYKYLNGGPGATSGIFIHRKLFSKSHFTQVYGWFGISEKDRFNYNPATYRPAPGAWSMMLSNDPIFNMLGLETSFEALEKCGLDKIFQYHKDISIFFYDCLETINRIKIITPKDYAQRGSQLSFYSSASIDDLLNYINDGSYFCEKRKNTIRIAPVAYNTYLDVWNITERVDSYFSLK
jgi:kynureninase